MLKYKPDFDRAKKYWSAFWQKEIIDRPIVVVRSPKKDMQYIFPKISSPYNYTRSLDGCIEKVFEDYEAMAERMYFGGEAIPFIDVGFGPDQFGAMFGSRIEPMHAEETTWVHAVIDDLSEFSPKLDRSKDGVFARLKEFYEVGARMSEGKYLLSALDMHSNLDALSALRGPQNLCFDLMDCEDEVIRVTKEFGKFYPEIIEMMRTAGNMEARGSIAWLATYLEKGKFCVTQCDFSALISPEQAKKHLIPALREEVDYLDHTIYHYDGKEALGHVDDILDIEGIDAIQWCPGSGNPRSIEWMDLLHKIQSKNKGLWLYDWTVEEIKSRFKELKPEGLVFEVYVGSEDEADELLEYLVKHM